METTTTPLLGGRIMNNRKELYEQLLSHMRQIQSLCAQKIEVLAKLEKAYAIQSLFVDMDVDPFKLGTVSVSSNDAENVRGSYIFTPNPDAKFRVFITRFDNGERTEFVFPLAEVPEVLWSDAYKRAVERQRKTTK